MTLSQAKKTAFENAGKRQNTGGRLGGKITVITGAAQGFGRGIAEELYREGACILIADLPNQERTANEFIKELGERAAFCPVDVGNEESVINMAASCVEIFGGLDIMISNAGILKASSLEDMDLKTFESVTRVNYTGFFLCAKYAAEIMRAQAENDVDSYYDIIQINSKSGLEGSKNNSAYSGSKFGGIGLVQSFAKELAKYRIKVNAVCPGNYYDGPLWSDPENGLLVQYLKAGKVPGAKTTEDVKNYYLSKSPIRRGCFPADVAKAVFYCVEQCFETGQALPVTGGQNMLS